MNIKNFFRLYGESSILGRPYKINRMLFLLFSIIILGAALYINSESKSYAYVECDNEARDKCLNVLYNSETCTKHLELVNNPVCTQQWIIVDKTQTDSKHPNGIGRIGNYPPWYARYYTSWVLGLFLILVIINTLLHNRHLFRKRTPEEKQVKDIFAKIVLGDDGKPLEVNHEQDNNTVKNSEGKGSNTTVCRDNDTESESGRSESEVKHSTESSNKDSMEASRITSRNKTGSKHRTRNDNNNI